MKKKHELILSCNYEYDCLWKLKFKKINGYIKYYFTTTKLSSFIYSYRFVLLFFARHLYFIIL